MPLVFIGIGSNLGDRESYFQFAARELLGTDGIRELKRSPVYETEPVGGKDPSLYWNAVWSFVTDLSPEVLLEQLHAIEARAGRQRRERNEARVLDLDILFYGDQCIRKDALTIPHPRLHERAFVLVPFCDLAPEFVHPVFKKTIQLLFNELSAKDKAQSVVRVF